MSNILKENEAVANIKCAKTFQITFYFLTFIYLLDVFGLFIIDLPKMTICYLVSSVFLWVPTVFNRIFGTNREFLKYLYVVCAALFIFVTASILTYHIIVIYVFPMAVAALYFSKRLNVISVVLTVIAITIANIVAFYIEILPDKNYPTLYEMIVYNILPKFLTMSCLLTLFILITTRTKDMVNRQQKNAEELMNYHYEMVMGFATMVENRDDNTGGHIKRTSQYAVMLATKLREKDIYSDVITNEFIENLKLAAPMHDVGKISVPDSILKKAGRLTEDEYELMKMHAETGGNIIKNTFGHTSNQLFNEMAYNVARFHHEKWNGKGYPDKKMGYEIPLSSRIMAVVDVFDAVSTNRCYRDAMGLDESLKIINEGKGEDFEPVLVDVFLELRDDIQKIMEEKIC